MLVFVHHGTVSIRNIGYDFAISSYIINAGIGIDVQNGHTIACQICGGEEACHITIAGSPTVINIVIQYVQPAIALTSV